MGRKREDEAAGATPRPFRCWGLRLPTFGQFFSTQFFFQHLAHIGFGQLIHERHFGGQLLGGQLIFAEFDDFLRRGGLTAFQYHEHLDLLAALRVRHADGRGLSNFGVFE